MTRARSWISGRRDLGTRLLGAILVVVMVGGATAWVVVAGIGPAIFHNHMGHIGGSSAFATLHAEEAFRTASALSLAVALAAALLASVVVSIFVTRRITRSLTPVTEAAGRVAGGDYSARVPAVGMGTEFDDLASAFNRMATDLGRIEVSRSQMLGDLGADVETQQRKRCDAHRLAFTNSKGDLDHTGAYGGHRRIHRHVEIATSPVQRFQSLHVAAKLHRIEAAPLAQDGQSRERRRGRGYRSGEGNGRILAISRKSERAHLTVTAITGKILSSDRTRDRKCCEREEEMDERSHVL